LPKDSMGKHHPNAQLAMSADKMRGKAPGGMKPMGGGMKDEAPAKMETEGGGEHSELHPHGDGTFHTVAGGQQTEHPHIGHALAHLAAHHAPEHLHSHVEHKMDGSGMHTSHHARMGGEVDGPHDHANMDALKTHMDQFLSEEGHEGGSAGGGHEQDGEMGGY
jgi:hypothetical protein